MRLVLSQCSLVLEIDAVLNGGILFAPPRRLVQEKSLSVPSTQEPLCQLQPYSMPAIPPVMLKSLVIFAPNVPGSPLMCLLRPHTPPPAAPTKQPVQL